MDAMYTSPVIYRVAILLSDIFPRYYTRVMTVISIYAFYDIRSINKLEGG
jgi:hypothetical protein